MLRPISARCNDSAELLVVADLEIGQQRLLLCPAEAKTRNIVPQNAPGSASRVPAGRCGELGSSHVALALLAAGRLLCQRPL
jgi:hypothetical protein